MKEMENTVKKMKSNDYPLEASSLEASRVKLGTRNS